MPEATLVEDKFMDLSATPTASPTSRINQGDTKMADHSATAQTGQGKQEQGAPGKQAQRGNFPLEVAYPLRVDRRGGATAHRSSLTVQI